LSVVFHLDKKKSDLNEEGLMRILTAHLAEHGILADYVPPTTLYSAPMPKDELPE